MEQMLASWELGLLLLLLLLHKIAN